MHKKTATVEHFERLVAIHDKDEDLESLRDLPMEERARRNDLVCRAAMSLERDKALNGLPPSEPTPWPASTWEHLRRHAADARRK
ncbi:MAG: hypothetical protein WD768_22110 [Phycisphaeraceae bacterium]